MRFVYWLEDVLHGIRERYPTALRIVVAALILLLFLYAGSMDYDDAQRAVQNANETAQKVQYWHDYKEFRKVVEDGKD